jgi:hypothetical protein
LPCLSQSPKQCTALCACSALFSGLFGLLVVGLGDAFHLHDALRGSSFALLGGICLVGFGGDLLDLSLDFLGCSLLGLLLLHLVELLVDLLLAGFQALAQTLDALADGLAELRESLRAKDDDDDDQDDDELESLGHKWHFGLLAEDAPASFIS